MRVIGTPQSFWRITDDNKYDLTHPPTPDSPLESPYINLKTTTDPILIAPKKTALVIIDMQNFFLAPELGHALSDSPGIAACDRLLSSAIPAARKAGIQVVWLNWGLTPLDIETFPLAARRSFGEGIRKREGYKGRIFIGVGQEIGKITVESLDNNSDNNDKTGETIEAGKMLCANQWNTQLYKPLEENRLRNLEKTSSSSTETTEKEAVGTEKEKQDVLIPKTRMSGLWNHETPAHKYFQSQNISTLLFAGVNTDQCVGGTIADAFNKGYDCLMLRDACGTTSPQFGQECVEYNVEKTMGFVLNCEDLVEGVEAM